MTEKRWPECLGETVSEIAESLKKQGVRGRPYNPKCCVIAESYKHRHPGGEVCVEVGYSRHTPQGEPIHYASLRFGEDNVLTPRMSDKFSRVLGEFLHRFDCGEFPSLVLQEAVGDG